MRGTGIIVPKRFDLACYVSELVKSLCVDYAVTNLTFRETESDFIEKPVPFREFVESKNHMDFMPLSERQLAIVDFMLGDDPDKMFTNGNNLAVLVFGKGSGKDALCVLILCYLVYVLICMRSPQAYFSFPEGEYIDCVNVAPSGDKASTVFFEKLRQRLLRWRWLKDKYPIRASGAFISQMKPELGDPYVTLTKDGIIFPKLIRLLSRNSDNESAEGLNTLAYFMDEACFGHHQPVMLADGSKKYISEIVNSRLPCEVLSYNFVTGKMEPKKVTNWFKYPLASRPMVRVKLNHSKFKYAKVLSGTLNHHIFTDKGVSQLGKLAVGDKVYCRGVFMSEEQQEFVLGSLLGDAHITPNFNLMFSHGQAQEGYLAYKEAVLKGFFIQRRSCRSGYKPENIVYQSIFRVCEDTHRFRELCYGAPGGKKYVSQEWADRLTLASLAYFYLDDGSLLRAKYKSVTGTEREILTADFSCYSLSQIEADRLVSVFARLGYPIRKYKDSRYAGEDRGYVLRMPTATTLKFLDAIAQYVPECMQYKLGGRAGTATALDSHQTVKLLPVVAIEPFTKYGYNWVYDIEVADNHNYFASDVLVSNSAFKSGSNSRNADKIYRVLRSSSKTRFGGKAKGFIFSYPREMNDFTMKMYRENLNNLHVYTDKAATWEVLPKGLRFKTGDFLFEGKLVPNELKEDFEKDPTESKMMYMAEPPEAEHGFIEYPEKIAQCVQQGARGIATDEHFVKDDKVCRRITGFSPGVVANRDYVVTVDLGSKSDTAALSVFHREEVGDKIVFIQDLVTGWVPDKTNKLTVSFENIFEYIKHLASRINIVGVWFDQWQSISLRESLTGAGIPAHEYMLDYSDYKTLKEMLYTQRVQLLPYEPQLEELKHLIDTGSRVDHTKTSSKDLADTITGALKVFMLKYRASSTATDEWGDVETIEENLHMVDPFE